MFRLQYAALKTGSFSIVNIEDVKLRGKIYPLTDWCVEMAVKAGFKHVRTDEYGVKRIFGGAAKTGSRSERVFVFKKV